MPTVAIEYQGTVIENANEYSVVTGMFLLLDEAKRQLAERPDVEAVLRLERWWITRSNAIFILDIDRMLTDVAMDVGLFTRCVELARQKAVDCGEFLERDYVNSLVQAIHWQPNTCRTSALIEVFDQLIECIRPIHQ